MAAPFRTSVIEPWIDYNGHLNEGYFGVVFAMASDDLLEQLGFDERYRNEERGTFYTAETHLRYLREVGLGDAIRIEMRILGVDEKRLHLWHEMYRETDDVPAATQETMLLHVDLDDVRVRPMGRALLSAAEAEAATTAAAPLPRAAGSAVRRVATPPGDGS